MGRLCRSRQPWCGIYLGCLEWTWSAYKVIETFTMATDKWRDMLLLESSIRCFNKFKPLVLRKGVHEYWYYYCQIKGKIFFTMIAKVSSKLMWANVSHNIFISAIIHHLVSLTHPHHTPLFSLPSWSRFRFCYWCYIWYRNIMTENLLGNECFTLTPTEALRVFQMIKWNNETITYIKALWVFQMIKWNN